MSKKICSLLFMILCAVVGIVTTALGYGITTGLYWFVLLSVLFGYTLGRISERIKL